MNSSASKILIAVIAAGLAGGLVYFVMQSDRARLAAENQQLRTQLAEYATARAAATASAETDADRQQREKDKTELLRLRGEVGRLRKAGEEAEKLRRMNDELTAALKQATGTGEGKANPEETDPDRQQAIAYMNDARQLALGLLMFAADNTGEPPTTLNQTSNYWGGASRLLTNQFELMLSAPLKEVKNPSATIMIRQKEAWLSKGKWVKVYGFVDGHSEVRQQPPEGFEAWEQQHVQPPPAR